MVLHKFYTKRGIKFLAVIFEKIIRQNCYTSKGTTVYEGHASENIKDVDVVVVSSAIAPNNPELLEAKKKGIQILTRERCSQNSCEKEVDCCFWITWEDNNKRYDNKHASRCV